MKAKHLFPVMALPLLFSCTQEELVAPQGNDNGDVTLQNRIKVGKIAFTGDQKPGSRFDFGKAQWENGDMFRLFLMDEWNETSCEWGKQDGGEQNNANNTHFMEQQVWNKMYNVVNRFSTNFPYTYNASEGLWENDDAVTEGNYFAVAPAVGGKQKEILDAVKNRRDVWVYINPVQKFDDVKVKTKMYDGVEENQFFLGYTQIYRNNEANDDDVLQLPLQMRPILANIDLTIHNVDEKPFKVEKLVISRKDGKPMPTIAYVRPCNNTPKDFQARQDDANSYYNQQWNKMATQTNLDKFQARYPELCLGHEFHSTPVWQKEKTYNDWAPAFAQPFVVDEYKDNCGKTITDNYWTIDSWTRTAARSVVDYSYPGEEGFTPYACEGEIAKVAYEYVIDFTNEKGEGVILNNGDWIRPFIALPHDMYMREYSFTVYGQQYDAPYDSWNEGIIIPNEGDYDNGFVDVDETDGSFTLPDVDPSTEASSIKAKIEFDDFRISRSRIVQTASAGDLLNHLESYFGKNGDFNTTKNEIFYVETLGDFVMTNELVDYVQNLYKAYGVDCGSKAFIYFTETKGVNGEGNIVFPANLTNDHAIDLFYYSKKVDIVNQGTQVIEKPIIYDYNESTPKFYDTLIKSTWYGDIFNDGIDLYDKIEPFIADNLFGGIGSITNEGNLTINEVIVDASNNGDAIYNVDGATLNIINSAIVGGKSDKATVHNAGTLNLEASIILGNITNDNIVNVEKGVVMTQVTHKVLNNNVCVGCPTGNAKFSINAGAYFYCPEVVNGSQTIAESKGEILVAKGAEAYFSGNNYGTITVEGKLIPYFASYDQAGNLTNEINGIINVQNGGHLMYNNSTESRSKEIINNGIIYVKGIAHVLINGGNGIIDVTEANVENGYEVRSLDMENQYFRYCLTGGDGVTFATLKKIVSEQNLYKNPFILETTAGVTTQHGLIRENIGYNVNVAKIKVNPGTELIIDGSWPLTIANNSGLGASYESLYVAAGGKLTVPNKKEFKYDNLFDRDEVYVVIDGVMRGENSSRITKNEPKAHVVVNGKGRLEYAGSIDSYFLQWEKGTIAGWPNEY
ncbi:MAG: hypothetical protein SOX26_04570 [Phocaeicola sp.]|nr:hypothetical protein [Phocaeicola sp.]